MAYHVKLEIMRRITLTNGFISVIHSKDEIANIINEAIVSNTILIYVKESVSISKYINNVEEISFIEEGTYLNINHIISF